MKTSKQLLLASMVVSITSFGSMNTANAQQQLPVKDRYVSHYGGNPYIPLWEHLPDGEPRVFEDPDNPGKLRAYIIGSHDVRVNKTLPAGAMKVLSSPISFQTNGT